MKPYLLTATDRNGRRETFGRDAASIEHLRAMLEREGFRDIEFIDDELSASLRAQRPETIRPATKAEFALEAKLRRGPAKSAVWLQAVRKNALLLLGFAGMTAYGLWSHRPAWAIFGIVLLGLWVWLIRRGLGRADTYNDLLRAFARGEWEQAQALLTQMQASPATQANEQLSLDLEFRQACLLARRGKLTEAISLVAPIQRVPAYANGLYDSRVASIYYAADQIDDFLAHMERAYEASGRAQLQLLDYAFAQSRLGDVDKAKNLLAQVQQQNLSALHKPIFRAAQGMCLLRDGDAAGACVALKEAVAGFALFEKNPATWPFQGMLWGYLAIASARAGNSREAKAFLGPWRDVAMTCLEPAARQQVLTEVLG